MAGEGGNDRGLKLVTKDDDKDGAGRKTRVLDSTAPPPFACGPKATALAETATRIGELAREIKGQMPLVSNALEQVDGALKEVPGVVDEILGNQVDRVVDQRLDVLATERAEIKQKAESGLDKAEKVEGRMDTTERKADTAESAVNGLRGELNEISFADPASAGKTAKADTSASPASAPDSADSLGESKMPAQAKGLGAIAAMARSLEELCRVTFTLRPADGDKDDGSGTSTKPITYEGAAAYQEMARALGSIGEEARKGVVSELDRKIVLRLPDKEGRGTIVTFTGLAGLERMAELLVRVDKLVGRAVLEGPKLPAVEKPAALVMDSEEMKFRISAIGALARIRAIFDNNNLNQLEPEMAGDVMKKAAGRLEAVNASRKRNRLFATAAEIAKTTAEITADIIRSINLEITTLVAVLKQNRQSDENPSGLVLTLDDEARAKVTAEVEQKKAGLLALSLTAFESEVVSAISLCYSILNRNNHVERLTPEEKDEIRARTN